MRRRGGDEARRGGEEATRREEVTCLRTCNLLAMNWRSAHCSSVRGAKSDMPPSEGYASNVRTADGWAPE